MSTVFSQNTDDLTAAARQSLEALLGQPLPPHQRVTIVVDAPRSGPPQGTRDAVAARIRELVSSAAPPTVADDEIDAAVEEAMASFRRC